MFYGQLETKPKGQTSLKGTDVAESLWRRYCEAQKSCTSTRGRSRRGKAEINEDDREDADVLLLPELLCIEETC